MAKLPHLATLINHKQLTKPHQYAHPQVGKKKKRWGWSTPLTGGHPASYLHKHWKCYLYSQYTYL